MITYNANDVLEMIDRTLHEPKTDHHPLDHKLAKLIARFVNARTVAQDMLHGVLERETYVHANWLFWRDEHINATEALGALGIHLTTYRKDNDNVIDHQA